MGTTNKRIVDRTAAPFEVIPQRIPVANVRVNDEYQRQLYDKNHPIFKAPDYDPVKGGVINVSPDEKEPNVYWVWDGMHRVEKAKLHGVEYVWAIVSPMTPKEQAREFVRMQDGRKGLKKWEVFKAELFAGDERAVAIARCLREGGDLRIGANGKTHVKAVQSVQDVYDTYGPEILTKTAKTITEIWPDENTAWAGTMWAGMALLLSEHKLTEAQSRNLSRKLPEIILAKAGMEKTKHTRSGLNAGQAKGFGPFVRDELLKVARKRK